MDQQLAPVVAARIDSDASAADAWEPQRLRIQAYLDAQRGKLAAIQRELNEHSGRLSCQPAGQPAADPRHADAERADAQRALDQARAECEQLRSQLAAAEKDPPQSPEGMDTLRREVEQLASENQ